MAKLIDRFVEWWLSRCPHYGADVVADLLEGDVRGLSVPYCRRCGAVCVRASAGSVMAGKTEWRVPKPTWFPRTHAQKAER